MKKKTDRATLKEAFDIHLRAAKDVQKYCPHVFAANIIYAAVNAVIPFATIYLSARIIDELAGLRRAEELAFWVTLTVCVEAALGIVRSLLYRWMDAECELFYKHRNTIFIEKMLHMDYADADKQETHDKRTQIQQSEGWGGWGLNYLPMYAEWLTDGVTGVLGAVALTVTLFTRQVPETAGNLTFLNHPLCVLAMLGAMAVCSGLFAVLANYANAVYAGTAEESRFGNRVFGNFMFFSYDQKSNMDVRMYKQLDMAEHYTKTVPTFGVGSPHDRIFRGPYSISISLGKGISKVFAGIVYLFVCLKAWGGAFGVGSVTQYVGAVTALYSNLSFLFQTFGHMRSNAGFLRTVYEFLDIPNSMYMGSLTTEKRSDRQYEVEFKDVSFKYPGSEIWALRHVNMKFKVGNRLAVVGENGSGKTTFIKLLCRLYDPQEGEIRLNGIDIRKYNYRQYMDVFSVVFQDFQLVSQSLGANVAGREEYDRERAEQALIDAGFGERLSQLPEGLDTFLYKEFGREGIDVSGGEAQKIAIARALYKDAPFIILDEPTAALDPIAEAEIYSKFNDIVGDKTAIYISHRLSSCKFCDEIAVFHQGRVIQQGSHESLLADEHGKYHELWHAQAQYYTEEA